MTSRIKNKKKSQQVAIKPRDTSSKSWDIIAVRLLTSITFFLVFLFTLFIAQPLLDQTQGNLYGVVASAWLVVALPSVAALLANIYGCNLIKKSAKAKSVPMAVILVTTGVLLAWLVLCVLRAANGGVDMSTEYWMATLVPVGVLSWLAVYVVVFLEKQVTGTTDILLTLFLGALVSGGVIFITAQAVFFFAFLLQVNF